MRTEYKFYSFDLWLTLIKSNPEFKGKRDEFFFKHYNPRRLSLLEVSKIIRQVDSESTKVTEVTGKHIGAGQMIDEILQLLGNTEVKLRIINVIYEYIQRLFLQYPPIFYDENTCRTLYKLKKRNKVLCIVSNTGFISGKTIKIILKKYKIQNLFDIQIFSDEIGISKPNPKIFKELMDNCTKLYPFSTREDILHIGDNIIADGGSSKQGVDYFQINTNNKSIIDLL